MCPTVPEPRAKQRIETLAVVDDHACRSRTGARAKERIETSFPTPVSPLRNPRAKERIETTRRLLFFVAYSRVPKSRSRAFEAFRNPRATERIETLQEHTQDRGERFRNPAQES